MKNHIIHRYPDRIKKPQDNNQQNNTTNSNEKIDNLAKNRRIRVRNWMKKKMKISIKKTFFSPFLFATFN